MNYYQETDSKIVFHLPIEARYAIKFQPVNETSGGIISRQFITPSSRTDITLPAQRVILQSENPEIIQKSNFLLKQINDFLNIFNALNFEINEMPPFHAFQSEDGAIIVEWTFKDFRIGFSFEENINKSGWYLITTVELGGISASGYLPNEENSEQLILWLLNFAISHN